MTAREVNVNWQLSTPPIEARIWTEWQEGWQDTVQADRSDAGLEVRLGWPANSLKALRRAFSAKLGRSTGWQSSDAAVLTAARVYKRGVACRQPTGDMQRQQRRGTYMVRIVDQLPFTEPSECLTFVDGRVAECWREVIDLPQATILTLDEHSKNLDKVADILELARSKKQFKKWRVIGGGLITDVVAFAAGLIGAEIEFVPTTLLAMADACVGGKTGVNFAPFGKNQVGLFYFPVAVHVWLPWLKTLPLRELYAGGAECIKHAFLIGDLGLARALAKALSAKDLAALSHLLPQVIGLKVDVVNDDPAENGRRAILNLGHTLAHALEAVSQERVQGDAVIGHGEAVGLGLLFAILVSERYGGLSKEHANELREILFESSVVIDSKTLKKRIGMDLIDDPTLINELKRFINNDKKNLTSTVDTADWILLSAPGKVVRPSSQQWSVPQPMSILEPLWQEFLSNLK